MSFERLRLHIATVLAWMAQRIAPSTIRTIFQAHTDLMETFPGQIAMGRRYGVVTVAWALDRDEMVYARKIERAGLTAMSEARAALEAAPFNTPVVSPVADLPEGVEA